MNVDNGFRSQRSGFEAALGACPGELVEDWIGLFGATVHFRIVGKDLAQELLRPFSHLRIAVRPPESAELSVNVWDVEATGIPCQAHPDRGQQNPHPASADGRFTMHFHRNSTLALDRVNRRLTGSFATPHRLSLYERGRPFHAPLAVWTNDRHTPIVHAGLVSRSGTGILLAGMGGSGKTTVAIVAAQSGFGFVSDDMIALESTDGGGFRGHGVFNSVYLEPAHINRFGDLRPHARQSPQSTETKQLVTLSDMWPARLKRSADIRALVLPSLQLDRATSSFHPASGAKLLMALGPSSRAINKGLDRAGFGLLAELTTSLPCYELVLGSDVGGIPDVLQALIDGVG